MTNKWNSAFVSGSRVPYAASMGLPAVWALVALLSPIWILALATPARAADPLIVISITGGGAQTICDSDCDICTIESGQCVSATEGDLLLCKPISTGLDGEITGCDWRLLFDGDDPLVGDDLEIDKQMRALEIAPNGNLVFVVGATDTIPGLTLKDNSIAVFQPVDVLKPYLGGGPYTTGDGTFKVYLDGELTQQDANAKPWDAVEILPDGACEDKITTNLSDDPNCHIIGSLSGGSGTGGDFGGVEFRNEDLIRCIPTGFGNGAVQACDYAVMLDSTALNGGDDTGGGITSDIEAIDFVSFDSSTFNGEMVFQKKFGNPTGFPPHEAGRDLLRYNGSFGSGECVPSLNPCADDEDCPLGESCNTGECNLGHTPCATDEDCSLSGDECNHTRPYTATITLFFDGSVVGLSGAGQKIEAFSIVPDQDGDIIPDGLDSCPDLDNPPSVCNDSLSTPCPSGLSSECPGDSICTQPDGDGDGTGDDCDLCDGRPDTGPDKCECGDGILDTPTAAAQANGLINEQCDLGTANDPAGPCTTDCKILGICTGTSAAACSLTMSCPPGEACCGDAITEPPEECDDGNMIEDDACNSSCEAVVGGAEIEGCDDLFGPNVVPAFVKLTKFQDTRKFVGVDRWLTKGDFNLVTGMVLDPGLDPTVLNQPVTITFNNTLSGILLQHTLPAGNFEFKVNKETRKKYLFKDKEADVLGADSWRKGKFVQVGNKVKYVLDGRVTEENGLTTLFPLADLDSPPAVRQTIRIGDICVTLLIDPPACELKGSGKTVKCKP